jgi:hypothetical protein
VRWSLNVKHTQIPSNRQSEIIFQAISLRMQAFEYIPNLSVSALSRNTAVDPHNSSASEPFSFSLPSLFIRVSSSAKQQTHIGRSCACVLALKMKIIPLHSCIRYNKGMNYDSVLRPLFHTHAGHLIRRIVAREWRAGYCTPWRTPRIMSHFLVLLSSSSRYGVRERERKRCSFTEYKLMSSYLAGLLAGECVCAVRPQPILTPHSLSRTRQQQQQQKRSKVALPCKVTRRLPLRLSFE